MKFDHSKYYYDEAAANKVIKFVEGFCTHIRGGLAGEPLILADFWKEDIIKPVFGIKRKSNGKRRFKTVYVEIGKGNAKSTVGSALALYLLGFDNQKGAEVYSVAGDREQARIIFDTAKFMINDNVYLKEYYETFQYSIVRKGTPNFYKVISAEAKTKHGFIPSAIIFDELHVQPNRDLWDTLTAGQMKRDESITFAFTTAGTDKESICYELHKKTKEIQSGAREDDSFLGVIYSAEEADDISLPETWAKANPGLGTIISVENLQIEYNKVLSSPTYENTFRRLHLNQWTDAYESWISDIEWMKCSGVETDLTGEICYGGLDLASTRDFNAFSLVFELGGKILTKQWYWLPKEMIDKRMINQTVNFSQWVREGYIRLTPGTAADHELIAEDIYQLCRKYNVKSIAYDTAMAGFVYKYLTDREIKMSAFDQSIKNMSFPTKELDRVVARKNLEHFGNPVLRWMMGNVVLYKDPNDNWKINKSKANDKVDGVVALVMAYGEYLTYKMRGESIYNTRGIATI
jgi:phage terminase large subunit-like protein